MSAKTLVDLTPKERGEHIAAIMHAIGTDETAFWDSLWLVSNAEVRGVYVNVKLNSKPDPTTEQGQSALLDVTNPIEQ